MRDEDYLRAWEPDAEGTWAERFTTMAWPVMCSGLRASARRGQALPFTITLDRQFAGQLTLGNVVRGSLRSAWVGYWVEAGAAGGGVATGAVALAVDHAFGPVGLHRIEAAAGRARGAANAARVLDLDLIGMDSLCLAGPQLVLPHLRGAQRGFVLTPLCDVAPTWRHPVERMLARDLLAKVSRGGIRPLVYQRGLG